MVVASILPSSSTLSTAVPFFKLGIQNHKGNVITNPLITAALPFSKIPNSHSKLRFGVVGHPQQRRTSSILFVDPSGGDIVQGRSEGSESGGYQGPPVLTILAGFLVFSFVCWMIGSIIMWLVALIINVPQSK